MAESSISLAQDQFNCSICLDLVTDPVTINCGHSYCMNCITDCWDQEDQRRVYSCPQCRQTFTPRPVLGKNTMLAELVEKLKRTKQQVDRPDQCYSGSGDVECDVCTGRKYKAIKSCLVCLNSYCQTHFERHEEFQKSTTVEEHASFQSLSVPPGSTDSPSITVSSRLFFDDVGKSVSRLREKLEHFSREEIEKIFVRHTSISAPEPKTREEFLQYSRRLTLDPHTASKNLSLSEGNRVIVCNEISRKYPDHQDRFDFFSQVLCRESVCGRCYWEVERSGEVEISVSYKSISRKGWGKECAFGRNDQSWCLFFSDSSCSFWHNSKQTELPVVSSSSRIGVYVDHSAGTLSFYSVSDTMTLIHRVHTIFTQPLYPGFRTGGYLKELVPKIAFCDLTI